MTECEYYRELISRLADDQLNSGEYSALSAHMDGCPECRAEYAVFIEITRLIKEDQPELPEGLHENIMAGVRRSAIVRTNKRRLSRRARYSIAAAACFGVVMLAAVGIAGELSGGAPRIFTRSAAMSAADVSTGSSQTATSDFSIEEAGAANAAVYASMAAAENYYTPDPYLAAEPEAEYQPELTPDPYLGPPPTAEAQIESAPAEAEPVRAEPEATAAPSADALPVNPATPTPIPAVPAPILPDTAPVLQRILPAPAAETSAPAAAETPAPTAVPAETTLIDMTEGEHWEKLMSLLRGAPEPAEAAGNTAPVREPAERPEGQATAVYTLALTVEGERRELTVYVYGDAVYYEIPQPLAGAGLYLAKCAAGDIEALAAAHAAEKPVPSETPSEAAA